MPHSARIDAPGVLHHIIIRGINNRTIFTDDSDRDNLLERLAVLLLATETACFAWAFLPDHVHLLIRSGPDGISRLMQRLLTGYARAFNRRHRRTGALFQKRFISFVCQEEVYFKKLRENGNNHLKGDERILGDGHFVEAILAKTNGKLNGNHHPKPNGAEFRKVEQQVIERYGIQRDLIYAKGRRRAQVDARSLLCYLAVRDLGFSRTALAKRLGMTQPAVGYAVDRGKQIAKQIKKVRAPASHVSPPGNLI